MAATAALPDQLIYLVILFLDIPEIEIPIPSPRTTTTLSVKRLIRANLPPPHDTARLRLIHNGKVLADATPLSTSLKLPILPPPRDGTHNDQTPGSKSKGKQPVRDTTTEDNSTPSIPGPPAKKIAIHCAIGDTLTPKELATEAAQAEASEKTLQEQYQPRSSHRHSESGGSAISGINTSNAGQRRRSSAARTSAPQPQGFDRLLSSGFTAQEVAALRSHFQTNLSYTHTPDTMPSQSEMRALEDRWLDSTATDPSPALTGETGETGWGAGFSVEEGGLDDMLYGYLTGFFFPLGALIWGFREEGVWTRRRQLAVVMGFVLNVAFGFMRWSS